MSGSVQSPPAKTWRKPPWLAIECFALVLFLIVPLFTKATFYDRITDLFVFAILTLGLNIVVGYTGLLHLGIGAFWGIGAYIAAILTISINPFQIGFVNSLVLATFGAAAAGLVLGAPTLRLRGDYLALVTLGFGEVVKVTLRNVNEITNGMQSLSPVPPPAVPQWIADEWMSLYGQDDPAGADRVLKFLIFYYGSLLILVGVVLLLRNLERSRLGRDWIAIREDELAATCMGINTTRVKLLAFAASAALAGLAGAYNATKLTSTPAMVSFGFPFSITALCCIILGGLGSIRGVLLGVLLLKGYENILAPFLDQWAQGVSEQIVNWLTTNYPNTFSPQGAFVTKLQYMMSFNNWKLLIFGVVLIVMVRFRPEGLLPSKRLQHEMRADGAGSMGQGTKK